MEKGNRTKKAYIDAVSELIRQGRLGQNSIRKIAEMTGFSVGNLYKHFSSFDELILYATVLHFKEYYFSSETLTHKETAIRENPIEEFMKYEALFAETSFSDPKLMYNLYFSPASKDIPRIIQDCLTLYYPDMKAAMPTLDSMKNHCELEERYADMFQLYFGENCETSREKIHMVSSSIFYLYRGFLHEAVCDAEYNKHVDVRKEKYLSCVQVLLEQFFQ